MLLMNTTDDRVGPSEKLVEGALVLSFHSNAGSAPPVVFAANANTRPSVFAMKTTSLPRLRVGIPVRHAGDVNGVSSGSLSTPLLGLAPGVPVKGHTQFMVATPLLAVDGS